MELHEHVRTQYYQRLTELRIELADALEDFLVIAVLLDHGARIARYFVQVLCFPEDARFIHGTYGTANALERLQFHR